MAKPKSRTHRLHDGFRTVTSARAAARDLRQSNPECDPRVKQIKGSLPYGVYVRKSCRL